MILSSRALRELVRTKAALPAASLLRKEMAAPVEALDDRRVRFVISTAAVDREFDTIAQEGWDLTAFLRNPVVLYGHDQAGYPIGRAVEVAVVNGALTATVEFVPAEIPEAGPRAEAVLQLLRGGFLAATSVGFRPLDWTVPDGESARGDGWSPGIDFVRQELCEFSIVTVPCNPEALIEPDQPLAPPVVAVDVPAAAVAAAFDAASQRRRRRFVEILALG